MSFNRTTCPSSPTSKTRKSVNLFKQSSRAVSSVLQLLLETVQAEESFIEGCSIYLCFMMPEKGRTEASAYSEMPTSSSVEARMPKVGMMVPKSPVSPSKLYAVADEAAGAAAAAAAAVEVEVVAATTGAGA